MVRWDSSRLSRRGHLGRRERRRAPAQVRQRGHELAGVCAQPISAVSRRRSRGSLGAPFGARPPRIHHRPDHLRVDPTRSVARGDRWRASARWRARHSGGRCSVGPPTGRGPYRSSSRSEARGGWFTLCNGRNSRSNHRKDVCSSAALFFDDPTTCYLQHPHGKARDRRYWSIFANAHGTVAAAFPGAPRERACPFAGDSQQPMRNLAIARGLEQDGVVASAAFGLCAHDDNPDVAEHWASWRRLLPRAGMAPLVPASVVLAAGRDAGHEAWASWMSERYHLRVAR
jgi:hypothetical protein